MDYNRTKRCNYTIRIRKGACAINEPISKAIKLAGSENIAVGKNATVYTDSYQFGDVDTFALTYKVTCTGTPSVKIEMEQSRVKPATENVADDNFAVPNTIADIETALTVKTIQHAAFTPLPIAFVRFKITELTNVVTDTVLNIWINMQKKQPQ